MFGIVILGKLKPRPELIGKQLVEAFVWIQKAHQKFSLHFIGGRQLDTHNLAVGDLVIIALTHLAGKQLTCHGLLLLAHSKVDEGTLQKTHEHGLEAILGGTPEFLLHSSKNIFLQTGRDRIRIPLTHVIIPLLSFDHAIVGVEEIHSGTEEIFMSRTDILEVLLFLSLHFLIRSIGGFHHIEVGSIFEGFGKIARIFRNGNGKLNHASSHEGQLHALKNHAPKLNHVFFPN